MTYKEAIEKRRLLLDAESIEPQQSSQLDTNASQSTHVE